jgi:hypothetical protein
VEDLLSEGQASRGKIAHSLDYPCAERLHLNLVWMGKQLAGHGEIELLISIQNKLARISVSTLKRLLPPNE